MSSLSPLRTGLTPPAGARVQTGRPALEGQAAFFRAAMGQASEATKTAATAPEVTARAETPKPDLKLAQGEAPSRLLRPGSLLDIRV